MATAIRKLPASLDLCVCVCVHPPVLQDSNCALAKAGGASSSFSLVPTNTLNKSWRIAMGRHRTYLCI